MTVSELEFKRQRNQYAKIWYAANKERICAKQRLRVNTEAQKESHNKASRKYYRDNKEKHYLLTKSYKDKVRALKPIKPVIVKQPVIKTTRIKKTIEQIKEDDRQRYYKRKSMIQQRNKQNRDAINKKYREHIALRREFDPLFKLSRDIPNLVRLCIKRYGFTKRSKTALIIGCDWITLKSHIESKFENWMNWDNRGKYNGGLNYGWDIDHIIPVSTAKNEEEMIKLNHYTNLQPLDSFINRYVKSNKIAL